MPTKYLTWKFHLKNQDRKSRKDLHCKPEMCCFFFLKKAATNLSLKTDQNIDRLFKGINKQFIIQKIYTREG
jgi:hypothetical protein